MYLNPNFWPEFFYLIVGVIGLFMGLLHIVEKPTKQAPVISLVLIIVALLAMTFTPANSDYATDRANYIRLFTSKAKTTSITDTGFLWYVSFLGNLLNYDVNLFFGISAFIYLGSYYLFIKRMNTTKRDVLLIVCLLNLNFLLYFTNTFRQGMALSFVLLGILQNMRGKKTFCLVMLAIGLSFHFSAALIVFCYLLSAIKIKIKWFYLFWIGMFVISYLDIAAPLTKLVSLTENARAIQYITKDIGGQYNRGFRYDFIIFSSYPMLMGLYYIKKGYNSLVYSRLLKTYILANAIWLIFVRIPYTNRLAYLSWWLIPFVVMLPVLDNETNGYIRNRKLLTGCLILFSCILGIVLNVKELF